MRKDILEIQKAIRPILKKYDVTRAAVFGSVARGEAKKKSDIDILVEISKDIGLLDFVHFKFELEDALGKRVDLVEYSAIKPLIRGRILKEQVSLL